MLHSNIKIIESPLLAGILWPTICVFHWKIFHSYVSANSHLPSLLHFAFHGSVWLHFIIDLESGSGITKKLLHKELRLEILISYYLFLLREIAKTWTAFVWYYTSFISLSIYYLKLLKDKRCKPFKLNYLILKFIYVGGTTVPRRICDVYGATGNKICVLQELFQVGLAVVFISLERAQVFFY